MWLAQGIQSLKCVWRQKLVCRQPNGSCCSVTKSCPTLCDPMDCSTPGLPCPLISPGLCSSSYPLSWWCQPYHYLSAPSPLALNLSQHQGLFQWIGSLHQVAKVLELQFQHQSFQWIFTVDFLQDWLVWSPCSPRDSQEPSPASQFESINSLALCLLIRKAITNLDSVLKSRATTLPTKVHIVNGFSSSHVQLWELDHKEGWVPKN